MEYAIIGALVLIVLAAVLIPLVSGSHGGDAEEFATAAPPPVVLVEQPAFEMSDDASVEREIARYRTSVAAGTICRHCGEANTADAKFCADCGKPIRRTGGAADAQEFA